MHFRKGPHAGRYAEQRYQEGLRSWRRTNRWLFVGFCGPFVAIGIAAYAVDTHLIAWFGGLLAGAGLALMVHRRGLRALSGPRADPSRPRRVYAVV
jgi:hypothetical protein